MADSYRLQVLKKLTLLLEGITVANGYSFDLAGNVFRGRSLFGEEAGETFLSIIESPQPGFGVYTDNNAARSELWTLLVQGVTKDDMVHPTDPLYAMADDVENRLAIITLEGGNGQPANPNFYNLGRNAEDEPLITSFQASPPVVLPARENVSPKAFFYMPIVIGLARA